MLILIGHGSFDGVEYKFNLVGPDISAEELARLCDQVPAKRQLIVNTTSASGGSIAALARPGRAVIAATKTGTEKNATIFCRYWVRGARTIRTPTWTRTKRSALWRRFNTPSRKTAAYYESEKRLATEHAVFEDTGKNEAVRAPSSESGEGLMLSSFTLVGFGAAEKRRERPGQARSARQKRGPRTPDRYPEIPKSRHVRGRLQKATYRRAGRPGASPAGVGQVRRLSPIRVLWMAGMLGASLARAATPDDCHALGQHGHRAEARACYESLTATHDPYLRAEGYWGLEMYQEANNQFRDAVAQDRPQCQLTACAGAA